MKNSIVFFSLLLFCSCLWEQNTKMPVESASIPIQIKWVDDFSGDFSFTNNWAYPEGVYKNEYGQISCDGFCPPEVDAMKDSTGRIYEDSLTSFYKIVDTTHQSFSIQSAAWCYEYNGANFIEVNRLSKNQLKCFTAMSMATHCSLNIEIYENSCYATINLNSVSNANTVVFNCIKGNITINKSLWKKGIMKAIFSFDFENKENPQKPIYWKGKILTIIK